MRKLFVAIRKENLDEVKSILERKPALVNCTAKAPPKSDEGQSPLQVAIKYGDADMIGLILDAGADVNFIEADQGLGPTECYRCPVLKDMVSAVYRSIQAGHGDEHTRDLMELVFRMLDTGADADQTDNREATAWDSVLFGYRASQDSLGGTGRKEYIKSVTEELLDGLVAHGADIYHVGELRISRDHRKFVRNMTYNLDLCEGVPEEERTSWEKRWRETAELVRPYYMKDNPYYGAEVSTERRDFYERLGQSFCPAETAGEEAARAAGPAENAAGEEAAVRSASGKKERAEGVDRRERQPAGPAEKPFPRPGREEAGREIVEALLAGDPGRVFVLLQKNPDCVDFVTEDGCGRKEYAGQSLLQVAVRCGCGTDVAHALIDCGADADFMPADPYAVPEGCPVTYCDGRPVFYQDGPETVFLPEEGEERKREPVLQSTLTAAVQNAGLGAADYAAALLGVAVHLLDRGADPDRRDSRGYTAWMPERRNEAAALTCLDRGLRLLAEYGADIHGLSYDRMTDVEDIADSLSRGHGVPERLSARQRKFWKGDGKPLLEMMEHYYGMDEKDIVGERARTIHKVLRERRYRLMPEIVERMEQGDRELIMEIAGLYRGEGTPEGDRKAGILEGLCRQEAAE